MLFILIAEVQLEFDGYRSYACHPQALTEGVTGTEPGSQVEDYLHDQLIVDGV